MWDLVEVIRFLEIEYDNEELKTRDGDVKQQLAMLRNIELEANLEGTFPISFWLPTQK